MTVSETRHGGAEWAVGKMIETERLPTIAFPHYLEIFAEDTITAVRQGNRLKVRTNSQLVDAAAHKPSIIQPQLQALTGFIQTIGEEMANPSRSAKGTYRGVAGLTQAILSPAHADQADANFQALNQHFAGLLVYGSGFGSDADQLLLITMKSAVEDFPQTAPQLRRLSHLATVVEGFSHVNKPTPHH